MTAELEKRLDALLDQYDAACRTAQGRKEQALADEQRFVEGFARVRRDILRPLFEATGAILVERGHEFRIREQEFAPQAGAMAAEAHITLLVAPAGMEKPPAADEHLRALSFTTRHYNKVVCVRNGAAPHEGTLAGSNGAYPLARIDLQLAEDELLKLMAAVVRI